MIWDKYFYNLCETVASKSSCLSRKIGAVIVRDNIVISSGYNSPPKGIPHCGHSRLMVDEELSIELSHHKNIDCTKLRNTCPRQLLGYLSGTHIELCPAQHAEQNAVSNAAKNGISINHSTLYMNCKVPCSKCFGMLINAGVNNLVLSSLSFYDRQTKYLSDNSQIKMRLFNF